MTDRVERGADNIVRTTDTGFVHRSALTDPARVTAEAELLARIGPRLPLPIPRVTAVDPELGLMVYPRLPGRALALTRCTPQRWNVIADALAGFLRALHAIPVVEVDDLVDIEEYQPDQWLRDAAAEYPIAGPAVPARFRSRIEVFLRTAPPPLGYRPTFVHNDLGTEHVLVVDSTADLAIAAGQGITAGQGISGGHGISGIIDWTDAAVFDPAYDLGLLCRDIPSRVFRRILAGYGTDDSALAERAVFYARCSVLEDIAYGVTRDLAEYRERAISAIARLFGT